MFPRSIFLGLLHGKSSVLKKILQLLIYSKESFKTFKPRGGNLLKYFHVTKSLFNVNNKDTGHRKKVQVRCSSVFTVDLQQAPGYIITIRCKPEGNPTQICVGLMSLLLTLNKYLPTETLDNLFAVIYGVLQKSESVRLFVPK